MSGLDIHGLMRGLAETRPVFHSEADFQFALAWRIREETGQDVRLEFPPFPGEGMYLDLWVPAIGTAVELKYVTREHTVAVDGESFSLRNHGAQPVRRYDFLKDVARLEQVVREAPRERRGVAVQLTNDPQYWKPTDPGDAMDAEFRIHQGRKLPPTMCWSERAGDAITRKRPSPIVVRGSYVCQWRDYGSPERAGNARFRYLAIEVGQ